MIQWVYERALKARSLSRVLIATDDERVRQVALKFVRAPEDVQLTGPELASGTDRVAAVADRFPAEVYVNVQGDEPMLDPLAVDRSVELVTSGRFPMGTASSPLNSLAELDAQAVVKVLTDKSGRALYFSRHPIPYSRGPRPPEGGPFVCRRHLGLYVYTRDTLLRFRSLPASRLEQAEVLEQLRALQDGIAIGVAEVDSVSPGVDTPEDLENVRRLLVERNSMAP
jgi:3-deoxy-manno-octulosonate cytidylyltransferase (CMP-KDO synthetase)